MNALSLRQCLRLCLRLRLCLHLRLFLRLRVATPLHTRPCQPSLPLPDLLSLPQH